MLRDIEDTIFDLSSLSIRKQAENMRQKTALLLRETEELLQDSQKAKAYKMDRGLHHGKHQPG